MKKNNEIKDYISSTNFRFERKYVISDATNKEVEAIIKNHQSYFKEIYNERYVNNIYFDTQNLTHYYDNSFGKAQRKKYRIRWYHSLSGEIVKPILEIKIKEGLLGRKESFVLQNFKLNENGKLSELVKRSIEESDLPERVSNEMKALFPTLINRYKRKYFRDFSKKFRVTIDSNVEYYNVINGIISVKNKIVDNKNIISELKYSEKDNNNAKNISSQFPFRMSKNSKYVNGIELFFNVTV